MTKLFQMAPKGAVAACAALFSLPITALGGATALAQQAPKTDNRPLVPSTVQPGAIEAQYQTEIAPDFSNAPEVLSPYEPEQPENADKIRFILNAIDLDGAQSIAPAEIQTLYSDKLGTEIALSEVFAIARLITRLYAVRGYPLSLAYVPIQEIDNGVVRIRIIEGYIGAVEVAGVSGGAAARLAALGEKLKADRPLTQAKLERYLLLANQIPGLKVTGVLEKSGAADGGVKMILQAKQTRLGVSAAVNNRASRAVGREQFIGRLGVNNLATGVDNFSFAAVQSFDLDELTYFSAGYGTTLNAEGLAVSIRATRSEAAPGVPFLRDLGFETNGWTAGVGLSYPAIISRRQSLVISGDAVWKSFESAFGVTPNTKDVLWTTSVGGAYSLKDGLNGQNTVSVSLTRGWDIFGATNRGSPEASRSGAGGDFLALTASYGRNQPINDWLSASFNVAAQTANKSLLSSEQCGFGGAGFGRAYDPFEISGDRCIVGILEFSAAPSFLTGKTISARPFVSIDAGAVRQIGPLTAGEARTASLYSLSAGARFTLTKRVGASLEAAIPLKGVVAQEASDDARLFFSVQVKY